MRSGGSRARSPRLQGGAATRLRAGRSHPSAATPTVFVTPSWSRRQTGETSSVRDTGRARAGDRRSRIDRLPTTTDGGPVDLSAVRRRIYPAGGPPPLPLCWRRRQAAASPGTASRICDDPRIWPDPPTRSQSLGFSRANPLVVQCKSQKCANGMQHAPSRINSFTGLAATGSPSRRTRIQTRPGLKSGPPGVMGS